MEAFMKVQPKLVSNPSVQSPTTTSVGSSGAVKNKSTETAGGLEKMSSADLFSSSKLNVSNRARDAQKIREAAMAAPDIDQEKVARFKAMIEKGEYKVDAQAVADRMLQDELKWSAETEA